jgi:hypothetical protein
MFALYTLLQPHKMGTHYKHTSGTTHKDYDVDAVKSNLYKRICCWHMALCDPIPHAAEPESLLLQ